MNGRNNVFFSSQSGQQPRANQPRPNSLPLPTNQQQRSRANQPRPNSLPLPTNQQQQSRANQPRPNSLPLPTNQQQQSRANQPRPNSLPLPTNQQQQSRANQPRPNSLPLPTNQQQQPRANQPRPNSLPLPNSGALKNKKRANSDVNQQLGPVPKKVKIDRIPSVNPPLPRRTETRVPVDTGPRVTSAFRGPSSRNYEGFLGYVKCQDFRQANFNTLGDLNYGNRYYFVESRESRDNAANFLDAFWMNEENRRLTRLNHHDKYDKRRQATPLIPACISFINAEIKDKKYCFISLSGMDQVPFELQECLKRFVNAYNKNKDTEFVLLQGDMRDFNVLTQHVAGNSDGVLFRDCSEKYYASCLTKLYLKYGKDLYITGVANGGFYPYYRDGYYGNQRDGKGETDDVTVVPPNKRDGFENLSNGRLALFRPCCQTCQHNKDAMLKIWKSAQWYGEDLLKEPELVNDETPQMTSPLHHSIASGSSLLPQHSLFTSNDKVTGHEEPKYNSGIAIKVRS